MSLIKWVPEIVQATDQDILRYGPNAARMRALLHYIFNMSEGADNVAGEALRRNTNSATDTWLGADYAANNAAIKSSRVPATRVAMDDAIDSAKVSAVFPALSAAKAEIVSDILDPQSYRTLTNPLNAGRVYELRLPDAGSEFMRLTRELRPASADDVERLADLSVDPRAQGIIELLQGLQGNMPLAAKIDAARRLDRASRAGRRMP